MTNDATLLATNDGPNGGPAVRAWWRRARDGKLLERLRAKKTLQWLVLALVAGLNVTSTAVACAIAFRFQRVAFLHGIDRVLTGGAIGAQHIYGDQFHREILEGKIISPHEEYAHVLRISDLVHQLNLNYISAVVRRDGKYYFTVSSSSPKELEIGAYDRIGAPYRASPALIATFNDGQIRFEEHENDYGDFRSAYVPYRLPGSDRVDYVFVADIGLDYIDAHLLMTLLKTAAAGLVICAGSLWLTWILARHVSGPMAKLAALIRTTADRDFQFDTHQRATLEGIAEKSYEEVADVSNAFCRMESKLQKYLVEIQHNAAERERIASELSIAHDIQMGLLPRNLPQLDGCDVFARVIPAKEVGGDLFDVAVLDERRLLLVVADVSGKGVSAGMFMAVAKTLLDVGSANCMQPQEIVRFLNNRLSAENDACMFVTMFLAIFNVETGEMHYTNAGHNPPYIRRADGSLDTLDKRHGMAIGIMGGQPYASDVTRLGPGDLLLMFSDGVTEAQDTNETLFSEERLEACLRERTFESAGEATATIIEHVRQFQGEAPQFDDITLVTLRYTAPVREELELTATK